MKGVSSRVFTNLFFWLVVFGVALVIMDGEMKRASAKSSEAQCHEERRLGVNACKPVICDKLPTAECRERVRVSHIECVFLVITPSMVAMIYVNRAVRLIERCGRMPRHFKCGSVTTT